MHTPWGDLRIADAHVHFFSHRFYTLLAAQKGSAATAESLCAALDWQTPPSDPAELARLWAAELDRHHVHQAALIASLPGDHSSVAAAVHAFPQRFFGYFLVNPLAENAPELLRAALNQGLRGIVLFPAMHRFSAAGDGVSFVYEAAASTPGSVVFVHCGILSVGVRRKLGIPSLFDLRFSNPVDLHSVALRFPHVPFVVPHFGAGFFREALMLADLCPNVYFDTSSTNSWVRTQPEPLDLVQVFARSLDVAGPRRLLFGTDSSYFPRGWHRAVFDQQIQALQTLGVSVEAAGQILGGNLRRILHSA
jgi:predicted TIM-barrel fold metal-dependent hydrolase